MHSYDSPSGERYHLEAEGSTEGSVYFRDEEISMRDILWLAALHIRGRMTSKAETASDFEILGLPEEGE